MRSSVTSCCHPSVPALTRAVFIAVAGLILAAAPALAATHGAPAARGLSTAVYDWQAMGHDASHTAYVKDAKMSAAIAPKLGVHWMTNLLSPDVGGPTIAYNPTVGKTLVYTGDERGNLAAYDIATGATVWTTSVGTGDAVYSTPLISRDETSVWVGTAFNAHIWKLNAATGAVDCSQKTQLGIQMSVTEGFAADGTPMVYASSIDGPNIAGPELGIRESDCSIVFSSNPYQVPFTGSWASPAYGLDANGRAIVIQGTADPDSSEYALDATTGTLDWAFHTGLEGDYDIGAAATVSAPGVNGFADGVLYFIDKAQIAYALDLTTGAPIWHTAFGVQNELLPARSAAALDRRTLVFGMSSGVVALDAVTGKQLWQYNDPAGVEVISNPAIVGPVGGEVVAFGDLAGVFHVLKLKSGAELYHYQTGGFITASPSYVNGQFLIASTDGFLYDFAAGGGNGSTPSTTITAPLPGAKVPYAATIAVSGTAAATPGVTAVQVAVQSGGGSGPWYDAATKTWVPSALTNLVAVASPGSPSSAWTFSVPVPTSGAALKVFANSVSTTQQADIAGKQSSFTVQASPSAPQLSTSAVFLAPAAAFTATGSGFGAGESVSFTIGSASIGSATASKTGTFSAPLTMPSIIPFGPAALAAAGQSSKKTAITPIDIANVWLQAGNGPAHTGYELNDDVFSDVIWPGGNDYLDEAWYYSAGAPVESSPAVYQNTVYFGNDSGTLAAVGTGSAAPLWTLTLADGAAIRSSPAIDTSTGNVVFTADDGSVYAASAATGKPVQNAVLGGLPTSPVVFNGTVFVGSDNGLLRSLGERSGTANWSVTMGGPVHATPSYDSATGILVTGDDSGAISAFTAASGTLRWRAMTNGAVTGSPTIAGGIVYAGSSDGNVYAYNESTGAAVWTFAGGTPFTSGTIYDPQLKDVYAGGANATLFAVKAASGKLDWTTNPGNAKQSPYVGISAATHLIFADDASGSLLAYRSSQFGRFNANHPSHAALTTAPAVNDGTVYVGAADGGVYAWTTTGALPVARHAPQTAAAAANARRWVWPAAAVAPAFSWIGRRDSALHVDSIRPGSYSSIGPAATPVAATQRSARAYLVFWKSPATAWEAAYAPRLTAALQKSGVTVSGAYVDAAPYPAQLSDAAVQAEVARVVARTGWRAGAGSTFYVVAANGAVPASAGICAYHGAFIPNGSRALPIVYALVPYLGTAGACASAAPVVRTGDAAVDTAVANIRRTQNEIVREPFVGAPSH